MAKIVSKTLAWGASPDPDVQGYNVYWAVPPATLDKINIEANANFKNVGKVSEVPLPLAGMPMIDGEMEIGIAAYDDVGNISDIASAIFPFDFQAPAAPGIPFLK